MDWASIKTALESIKYLYQPKVLAIILTLSAILLAWPSNATLDAFREEYALVLWLTFFVSLSAVVVNGIWHIGGWMQKLFRTHQRKRAKKARAEQIAEYLSTLTEPEKIIIARFLADGTVAQYLYPQDHAVYGLYRAGVIYPCGHRANFHGEIMFGLADAAIDYLETEGIAPAVEVEETS